jgi:hypothetical protein
MRIRPADVFLVLVSVLVCAVVAEVTLRAFGIYGTRTGEVGVLRPYDDPVLDFRLAPNETWTYNGIPYRTNARGWRDVEHSTTKNPGVTRILFLGDSVLNGHGIRMEDVWARRTEDLLNEGRPPDHPVECVMLAIGALNTVQEAHLLGVEGRLYDPDVVVVGYVLNDPDAGMSLEASETKKESGFHRFKQSLKGSSLVFHTFHLADVLFWKMTMLAGRHDTSRYIDRDYFGALHRDPVRWGRVVESFETIRALCAENGTPVVVVIFPVLFHLDDYPWKEAHAQVAAAATANGFHVLDLTDAYRSAGESATRLGKGDHVHPNERGHLLAAEAFAEFVERERILPPPAGATAVAAP